MPKKPSISINKAKGRDAKKFIVIYRSANGKVVNTSEIINQKHGCLSNVDAMNTILAALAKGEITITDNTKK